ncbi:GAF domain-containing protein [Natronospirillum operosum]|uniref:GAF domain-containing protein n=1 Tax=Natronospirillum operosum TaxID=2759953 RepID=A0A4Z0W9A1_9GAMM|nr:HD domain-containing phosphohydrolase [Natronospirillum operosum]TGG90372.1 GAF domain-containing protein [Natronospirillum operosum]
MTTAEQAMVSGQQQEDLLTRLASRNNLASLLDCIVSEAMQLTNADGGTLYLVEGDGLDRELHFSVVRTDSLGIQINGYEGDEVPMAPIPLFRDGQPNHHNVASHAALSRKPVIVEDAYKVDEFDFSGTKRFDESTGYRSCSFLTQPLLDHQGEVIGVLQLLNARDPRGQVVPFAEDVLSSVAALAKYAAISLNNQILIHGHKELLDSFIKALASITDVRSPHTSLHCQRIPELTELIARAACEDKTGYFKDFNLDDEEWYELSVAAWLHDCGKLATPDYVVDKATKLHMLWDGIDAVRARFSALRAQTERDYLQRMLAVSEGQRAALEADLQARLQQIDDDCAFVTRANTGGEFMRPEDQERVRALGNLTWTNADGEPEPLLTEVEIENLCISRGTLNNDERAIINRHIDITIDILEALPFPRNLRRVPEYAGGHHEKMNGKGFPRGLTRDQLSIPARIMGVADIFEALTAKERPYKKPMPLSQAFSILRNMRDEEHIDADVYEVFLRSGVWKEYAERHLLEAQKDVDDATVYL